MIFTGDKIYGMKQVLTIVCKLQPTPNVAQKIEQTLVAFADACNYTNQNFKPNITSKTTIQSLVYQTIREKYNLSALTPHNSSLIPLLLFLY